MIKLLGTVAVLTMIAAPALAHPRSYARLHPDIRSGGMNFLHYYSPGAEPGTVATYDGSPRVNCKVGAAAYLGQDRKPHPCN
jgi:hypothetical protein